MIDVLCLLVTDMQGIDDVAAMLPQGNEIDLAKDWPLLGNYDPTQLLVRILFFLCFLLFFVVLARHVQCK